MSQSNSNLTMTEQAEHAEGLLRVGISQGSPTDFINGFLEYEKVITFYEGIGKTKDARKLLARLEKILGVVIDNGDPEAPYYSKLGPFFILYAHHFHARILEILNLDLTTATKSRVAALDYAIGVEWIEQVLNIMVDLLIEGYVDHCVRYLKFTKDRREELIEEIAIQIEEIQESESRGWFSKKQDPDKAAVIIYESFLRLLGLMMDRYNKVTSFLEDGLAVLSKLKHAVNSNLDYLDQRLIALEANIKGAQTEEIGSSTISHVKSRIIPHTIMDDPKLAELEKLLNNFVSKKSLDLDVAVGEIPILGANPAGSPHLSIIGQTGVGKTTLAKQVLKENIRAQNSAVIVFDHHFEYQDIADHIIQIGGERTPDATKYYPVEEIGDTFKQAQKFIQDQQKTFSAEGADAADLVAKIKEFEEKTRPTVSRFVVDTIEALISREEETMLPIESQKIITFWVIMDDAWMATTVISTIIKYILQMAIHDRLPPKTIMVTEEAQRLAGDQWIRNVTSEGRKFGLNLISISQVPEFDPWVVANSELILFRLRRFDEDSPIAELFSPDARTMVTQLETGEYLNYNRDRRSWVLSYNPESLTPLHAKQTINSKVEQLLGILAK
ncbi:MAG: ATP-binding protein [Candidatus Heimdallarchaeota archaeon]|nr:ATP-binding protein [Candidatus Heimdallarchaeota archaeon]